MPKPAAKPPRAVAARPAETRQVRAEATRGRVIATAIDCFAARSYDTVAVSEIADAAGVAHGLVFHYFGNKRGLYLAAMREVARQLDEVHAVARPGPPAMRIRTMLERHLVYMRRHPALALTLLRGGLGTDPEAWQIIEDTRWKATAWICRELGLDPARPALRLALRSASGAIDEATVYWIEHRRVATLQSLLGALVELLVAALRAAARLDPALEVGAAVRALAATRGL